MAGLTTQVPTKVKNNYELLLDISKTLYSDKNYQILRQLFTIEELLVLDRLVDRALMKEVE